LAANDIAEVVGLKCTTVIQGAQTAPLKIQMAHSILKVTIPGRSLHLLYNWLQ
jgi:hypothetical protein